MLRREGTRKKSPKVSYGLHRKDSYGLTGKTNVYSRNRCQRLATGLGWWQVRASVTGAEYLPTSLATGSGEVRPGPTLALLTKAAGILTRPSPAYAPPASPHPGPAERRCGGQSTSCPARSCRHSRCRRRRSPAGQAHGQSGSSLGCMATGSPAPLGTMGSWADCWQGHQELGC